MKKHCEISKISKVFVFTRKNLRRFPGFAVVFVIFFRRILDELHDFVFGMCFSRRNQQPILGGHRFSGKK